MHLQTWRVIIFFLFLVAFLVTAPAVVLYTAGYRYLIGTGRIVQTGVLNISTVQKGARVFIDEKERDERTPAVIDNVLPQEHTVRLEKEGYSSWEKRLTVESKRSAFVTQAVLFLKNGEEKQTTVQTTMVATDPSSGTVAFIRQTQNTQEVWLLKPFEDKATLLATFAAPSTKEPVFAWSPFGRFLRFHQTLIDTHTEKSISLPEEATFFFDVAHAQRGFVLKEKGLLTFDFMTQNQTELSFHAQSIQTSGDTFAIIQQTPERSVLSLVNQSGIATILAYLPLSAYEFVKAPDPFFLLHDPKHRRLILINRFQTSTPILLNTDATIWDWSPTGTDILFSDGFDIEIYKTATHEQETVTRLSEWIYDLAWYPSGRVVVYATDTQVHALELDRRGQQNKTVLADGVGITNIWLDARGEWMTLLSQNPQGILTRTSKRLQK